MFDYWAELVVRHILLKSSLPQSRTVVPCTIAKSFVSAYSCT